MENIVALVDPIRTAKVLIDEVKKRGWKCVIVESGFVGSIPHSDVQQKKGAHAHCEDVVTQLKKLNVTHIVGCVDPSLIYADQLNAQLGFNFNGLHLSEARRNKATMIRVVGASGLRVPKQIESSVLPEILEWLKSETFPVVIKPVDSGGSDDVYLCSSENDVAKFFQKIIGSINLMGILNQKVIVQEYVDGDEYVVNMVTFKGEHIVTDVCKYKKGILNGRHFIYEKVELLLPNHPTCARLINFAKKTLDALGFRTGASHMEIKINQHDEVVFIEVGGRLAGGNWHEIVRAASADGKSQVELSIDALESKMVPPQNFKSLKSAIKFFINAQEEGILKGMKHIETIMSLPSYLNMDLHFDVGQQITKTTSFVNNWGSIDLCHMDEGQLRKDELILDAILLQGLFVF